MPPSPEYPQLKKLWDDRFSEPRALTDVEIYELSRRIVLEGASQQEGGNNLFDVELSYQRESDTSAHLSQSQPLEPETISFALMDQGMETLNMSRRYDFSMPKFEFSYSPAIDSTILDVDPIAQFTEIKFNPNDHQRAAIGRFLYKLLTNLGPNPIYSK